MPLQDVEIAGTVDTEGLLRAKAFESEIDRFDSQLAQWNCLRLASDPVMISIDPHS